MGRLCIHPMFLTPLLLLGAISAYGQEKKEGFAEAMVASAQGWRQGEIGGVSGLLFQPLAPLDEATAVFDAPDETIRQGNLSPVWLAFEYYLGGPAGTQSRPVLEVRADCVGLGPGNANRLVGRFRAPASRWYLGTIRLTDAYFGGRIESGEGRGDFSFSVAGSRCCLGRVWVADRPPEGYDSIDRIGSIDLGRLRGRLMLDDLDLPAGNLFVKVSTEEGEFCDLRVGADGEFWVGSLPEGKVRVDVLDSRFRTIPTSSRRSRGRVKPLDDPEEIKLELEVEAVPLQTMIRSKVDGSLQPAGLYLPKDFNRRRTRPLIVGLHGTGENELALLEHLDLPLPVSIDTSVIFTPAGRGDSGFDGIAERDIFDGIDRLREDMDIDPERIYLIGTSMGATAAARILALRPGCFAAGILIEPEIDRTDFPTLPSYVYPHLWTHFPFECLPNLAETPTLWVHDEDNVVVPSKHSQRAVEIIREAGGTAELQTLSAGGAPWKPALGNRGHLRWLLRQERSETPMSVRFTTPSIRYARSWWVGVDRLLGDDPFSTIEAQIEVVEENQMGLAAEGIGACRLLIDEFPVRFRREVLLFIGNQQAVVKEIPSDNIVRLDLTEPPIGYVKTPDRVGPWKNAFASPFVYVVGAVEEERILRAAMRLPADRKFFLPPGPIRFAQDLTDEEKRTRNLICFGSPNSAPLFESALRQTPFRMEPTRIRVGARWFEGENLSLHLVYPNHYSTDRLIQMNFSFTPEVLADFAAARYHLPDFAILDEKGRSDETGWEVPLAGWFSQNWELRDEWVYLRDGTTVR